jgi:7-keto-8-aminopelargonate synthetase-like enzyme
MLQAVRAALKARLLGVAASRLTTGNHPLYGRFEKELAAFFEAETALLVPTGYLTNLTVAQALSGEFSHALIDELAHPSLIDAATILECPILKFGHRSASHLRAAVNRCGPGAKLIVLTDGMFARNGSVAPLNEYREALPDDALLLVDDAHGAGVLGRHGCGTLEYTGTSRKGVIQTITMSKAFGAYGGVILGSRQLRTRIFERSHLFIGSTPLPLPLIVAGRRALRLAAAKSFRTRLIERVSYVRNALKQAGLPTDETPGPIIALAARSLSAVSKVNRALLKKNIFPPFIKYPGAPKTGYFRFVISSEHRTAQLKDLVTALSSCAALIEPLN